MERSKESNISMAHETPNLNILLNIYEAKEMLNIHEFFNDTPSIGNTHFDSCVLCLRQADKIYHCLVKLMGKLELWQGILAPVSLL